MIELYTWGTPNGRKVSIMLEECKLPYRVHKVDITQGEQFAPAYVAINPNGKIPAIVDPDGPDGQPMKMMESGAILVYLAGKTGRFLPASDRGKYEALQWLMFQMGGVGPMLGQAHHFRIYAPEPIPYAIDRYTKEAARLYRVLDRRLEATGAFLGGRQYSIADIATWPWIRSHASQGIDLADYPGVKRWYETIGKRAAVVRALGVLADRRKPLDEKARENLFGATQYAQR